MDSNMDSNYVFLCGVMWCRFGQQDAGKELLRAADSGDPDMKVLAGAMFANGMRRLRESEKRAQPVPAQYLGRTIWRRTMWIRSCAVCRGLLRKFRLCDSVRCRCGWI